jgi:hypothetical protein
MTTVEVRDDASGRSYRLTSLEVEQFDRELSRTAPWRTLRGLINFLLGRDRVVLQGVADDARVIVDRSGRVREYGIYARTILGDVRTRRKRQFYMGILLLEWLDRRP